MGLEPVQHVQDSCRRLIVIGEDATAKLFLDVWEEVVVAVCKVGRIGRVRQQIEAAVHRSPDRHPALVRRFAVLEQAHNF